MKQPDWQALDRAVCGAIWAAGDAARNLESLCLDCGSRFAGSASERCAVELLARLWAGYGLQDVHSETYPFTAWERGGAALRMTAPAARSYPCLALPYSPGCRLEAELVDLGYGTEADYAAQSPVGAGAPGSGGAPPGDVARGRIVLVKNGAPPGAARGLHRMEKYMLAVQAGAAAFLFADDQPGMLAPTGSLPFIQDGPFDQALPSAGVPHEIGQELARRAAQGPVRLALELDNRFERTHAYNVVGEMGGHDPSDQRLILVTAHMDGHDVAQGAVDNGSGVIAVTEAARALAPLAAHLPCRVRFICFGAEELGMVGSYAYAAAHAADLPRIPFVFNVDIAGTGGGTTLLLQNCSELAPYFRDAAAGLAADINVVEAPVPFSDNFPFTLQGVPASYIHSSGGKGAGRGWAHTAADTLDKVDVGSIRSVAAAVARLVLRVANDPPRPESSGGWLGRRRTPAEVKAALEAYGAEPLLRFEGHWPF